MAFFGPTIENINQILPHSNADKLELAFVGPNNAFQCIVRKDDNYKIGEQVIYFPVDSVLSDEILTLVGLTGKLNGKQHNRLSISKKIRGEYAVGLIVRHNTLWSLFTTEKPCPDYLDPQIFNKVVAGGGFDTNDEKIDTTVLGIRLSVKKYELPISYTSNGPVSVLPRHLSKYDIESTDREKEALDLLMNMPVVITEKIEGQNAAFSYVTEDDHYYVCSRSQTKLRPTDLEISENRIDTFWKNSFKFDLENKLRNYAKVHNLTDITLYAEQIGPGIQGNLYKLPDHTLKFFDVKINGKFVNYNDSITILCELGLIDDYVPVMFENYLLKDILDETRSKDINQLATGTSNYYDGLREGIVIKPYSEEKYVNNLGRLILKKRSLEYLEKTGN